jgi:predicted amidohydrolase
MKKNITRFILIACAFVFSIALVLSWALFWPMPKLALPVKYRYVFIKSINIVDVVSGKTLDKRDILIRGNTISKIDTSGNLKIPLKALVVNGSNKFLIPGLWDMHTHSNQFSEWLHHPLYIAKGVTGIRDMSGQLGRDDS